MYKVYQSGDGSGTSLQGYLVASYDDLVHAFGPPTYDDTSGDNKVDIEWVLTVQDATYEDETFIVTIYNWKDYDGGIEATSNPQYEWHIGAKSKLQAMTLKEIFEEKMKEVA
jgi:hypothetical protein